MRCFSTVAALQRQLRDASMVGFVPTMGALHLGHKSLIDRARRDNDVVVVSIFVNPLQFAPGEDLENYPATLAADRALCEAAGVDILFLPNATTLYGNKLGSSHSGDRSADSNVQAGLSPELTQVHPPEAMVRQLCGRSRSGHFQGVATVVTKLLNIVRPTRAYFGQKDAQQLAIIRRLATDLNLPGEIIGCPIVREPSGLALSSRNAYLSPQEAQQATALSRGLHKAREVFKNGERCGSALVAVVRSVMAEADLEPEYIELVHPDTVQPIKRIEEVGLLAIAAQVGSARLIDNTILERSPKDNEGAQQQGTVAMDGPAGAGKSTVTRRVAQALGLRYLDTGAMYRALTWLVLDADIDPTDEAAVAELMATRAIRFDFPQLDTGTEPGSQITRVWAEEASGGDREITQEIRTPRVSQNVSTVAAQPLVREHLVKQQQQYGLQGGIVAEGRDIGTTVFPQAELKIFLTATIAERAKRRLLDLEQQGQTPPKLIELEAQIAERDHKDSTRAVSPLKKADDAIELLTDGLTIEEVTEKIVALYRERST